MSGFAARPPWRWVHDQLGRSLPIARRLWRSRLAVAAVAAVGLAVVVWSLRGLFAPAVTPLAAEETRRAAAERLAGVKLAPWDPGEALAETELPAFLPSPPPGLWADRHPGDPIPSDLKRIDEARTQFVQGQYVAAATLYQRAGEARAQSWVVRYHAGLALYRAGFHAEAAAELEGALERLAAYDEDHAGNPVHHAAVITTRYAAALATRRQDCVQSIRHLKLAVRGLRRFVETEGALVFDRRLPFRVAPTEIGNYDVWNTLAETYLECEGTYPGEYFALVPEAKRFRQSEYGDPDLVEVRDGPFPRELAACIANDGALSRCWALSNLNRVYYAGRQLYPGPGDPPPAAFRDHLPGLARLAYNVARTAAPGPDGDGALVYLRQAARLDRAEPAIDLGGPLADLGRYLAPRTGNYAVLAEPYRGRGVDELPFAEEASPEAVKGMAWALTERWQAHLAARRPESLMREVDDAVRQVPAPYLESLVDWRRGVRRQLREALAGAIDVDRRKGDLATAVALRDFRAEYLGAAWPRRARLAWLSPGLLTRGAAIVVAYLLLVAALAVVHRFVVYPYVLYTTDFYRTEFQRRYAARRRAGKPFTGREIRDWNQRRDLA